MNLRSIRAVRAVPDMRTLDMHAVTSHRQRPGRERGALDLDLDSTALLASAGHEITGIGQKVRRFVVRKHEEVAIARVMIDRIVIAGELGRRHLPCERDGCV
jgi:hypothetical protein